MSKYKLIASDLDGTLFGSDWRISEENMQAIAQLHKQGVYFVPASGRAFDEMPSILREHPLIRYYITSDGAMIYDKQTARTHYLTMPQAISNKILDKLYEYPVNIMLHADTNSYVDAELNNDADYKRCNYDERWRRFVYKMDVPVKDFKKFAYEQNAVQMLCVFFEHIGDIEKCKEYFSRMPEVLCAQSCQYNLEIFSASAGKGNALLHLAQMLGIPQEQTLAMGDSTNDMTMIRAAGLGVAVQNAVPALRAAADEVIVDHNSHALRHVVEKFI